MKFLTFTVLALVAGGPLAGRAATLAVRLADWAQIPISGNLANAAVTGSPAYFSRVNFFRDEPGAAGRVWICDLNGNVYILPKAGDAATRTAALLAAANTRTPYLDFNGAISGNANDQTFVPTADGRSNTTVTPSGLFKRFIKQTGYANGLVTVQFDPGYATNGKFYTIHIESVTADGNADRLPVTTRFPGFNATGYTSTAAQSGGAGGATRHAVLIEWTDTNTANATFEGSARELLRIAHTGSIHPMGDLIFNPLATTAAHPDWGVLYVAIGDGGSGESNANDDGVAGVTAGDRHFNPQRLDTLQGKILRIIPDLAQAVATSTVSANGRYRIPADNPFVSGFAGARPEVWTYGHRNPHRLSWDATSDRLITCEIGLHEWEEINLIERGKNYGYGDREGPQQLTISTTTSLHQTLSAPPTPDTLPVRLTASTTLGTVAPTYPAAAYRHVAPYGDAISSGFVYRGAAIPALRGKFVFGDITTGRLFFCDLAELIAAQADADPTTLATIHDLQIRWDNPHDTTADAGVQTYARMFEVVLAHYLGRGGLDGDLPGGSTVSGNGRADIRLAVDAAGELFVLSKSDGMIRQITALASPWIASAPAAQTTIVAGAAAFSVEATGDAGLQFQWQRAPAGSEVFSDLAAGTGFVGVASPALGLSDVTLAMNGDRFRCVVSNGLGDLATSAPATLTVITAKEAWLRANFTAEQRVDNATSGDLADPDGDGLANALEYALALDPRTPSAHLLPVAVSAEGALTLTYTRQRAELVYQVEASEDLVTWSPAGVTTEVAGAEVTARRAVPPGGRAFLRLRVSPLP